ncbi:MAG: ROK family protein [Blastocatellia bacterium]|nr:ROK family protein [Blastocatellia bacterium]
MANTKYFIGIDLGGTNIKAALVDTETGEIDDPVSIPTHAREGYDSVISQMNVLVNRLIAAKGLEKNAVGGIGVGVPGAIDMERGRTLFLPNLPGQWRNVPLAEKLGELSALPVRIINDARAMTLGEWKFGAGKGVETVACYTLGTGIGGGLIINNQLHLGIGGGAGELGHVTIDMHGPKCGCGANGCVEAYASGPAIAAMGMKAVVQGATTRIAELCENDLNRITPELICQAAVDGDSIAKEIYEQAGYYIGVAVASIVTAINPRRVVMGGGVAAAGEVILDPIRRTVQTRVCLTDLKHVQVVLAELGNTAGLIGAAMWAKQHVEEAAR